MKRTIEMICYIVMAVAFGAALISVLAIGCDYTDMTGYITLAGSIATMVASIYVAYKVWTTRMEEKYGKEGR